MKKIIKSKDDKINFILLDFRNNRLYWEELRSKLMEACLKSDFIKREFYSDPKYTKCVWIGDGKIIKKYPELKILSCFGDEYNLNISCVDEEIKEITQFLFDFL